MNNALPPALTPEQWSKLGQFPDEYEGSGIYLDHDVNAVCVEYVYVTQQRHALAALCLYDQPYGFTREDVVGLRAMAEAIAADFSPADPFLLSLANRITALLPPA